MTLTVLDKVFALLMMQVASSLEAGAALILGQLPDIITQTLNWFITFNFVMTIVFIALGTFFCLIAMDQHRKLVDDFTRLRLAGLLLYVALTSCAWGAALDALLQTLQIIIAPKLFLINYAHSLVN
jgi:hypothetical protein